jgi:ligand-binding sensor protein
MDLTDLISEHDLIALRQELHDTFGLNADIMDADGKRLAGNTWGNDLCRAIREDDKGFGAICAPAGQMFGQLMKKGEPFAEFCDGGMMRVSVPVMVGGEFVGAVGGCGLVPDDDEVDTFSIGMMSGLDESFIDEKVGTVKSASEAQVQEIIRFIRERVQGLMQ